MDMQSITRWEDYSRAKDTMMQFTDISDSPWYTVESDDKKSSRINVIAHLLSTIPYEDLHPKPVEIPSRPAAVGYHRPPRESNRYVPDHAHTLPIVIDPKAEKAKAKKDDDKKAKGKGAHEPVSLPVPPLAPAAPVPPLAPVTPVGQVPPLAPVPPVTEAPVVEAPAVEAPVVEAPLAADAADAVESAED